MIYRMDARQFNTILVILVLTARLTFISISLTAVICWFFSCSIHLVQINPSRISSTTMMYQFIKRSEQSAHRCSPLRRDRNIFNNCTNKPPQHRLCSYATQAAKATFHRVQHLVTCDDRSEERLTQKSKQEW